MPSCDVHCVSVQEEDRLQELIALHLDGDDDRDDLRKWIAKNVHYPSVQTMESSVQKNVFALDAKERELVTIFEHDTMVELHGAQARSLSAILGVYTELLKDFGFTFIGTRFVRRKESSGLRAIETFERIRRNVNVCSVDRVRMQVKRLACPELSWRVHMTTKFA